MEVYISVFCFLCYRAGNREGSRWHCIWKHLQCLASPVQFINIHLNFFQLLSWTSSHKPWNPRHSFWSPCRPRAQEPLCSQFWSRASTALNKVLEGNLELQPCRCLLSLWETPVCERLGSALPGCPRCSDSCQLHWCPHSSSLHFMPMGLAIVPQAPTTVPALLGQ